MRHKRSRLHADEFHYGLRKALILPLPLRSVSEISLTPSASGISSNLCATMMLTSKTDYLLLTDHFGTAEG